MSKLIKLKIGAQNAKLSYSFGPILGQAGINIKSFCDEFNIKTIKYFINIPLIVYLIKNKDNTYIFKNIRINLNFYINYFVENNKISLINFYKIIFLNLINVYNDTNIIKNNIKFLNFSREIYAFIKTKNIRIIN